MSRPPFKDLNILFLDFETGGLSSTKHSIVEAAAILTGPDGVSVIDEYCAKVFPARPVDPQAAVVNGYNQEKWAQEAIPIERALIKILTMASNAVLTCHNTPFDKAFLDAAIYENNMRWSGSYYSMDTKELAMPLLKRGLVPNVKLGTLTNYFSIPHEDAHTAMSDVKACRALYLKLMELYGSGLEDLSPRH